MDWDINTLFMADDILWKAWMKISKLSENPEGWFLLERACQRMKERIDASMGARWAEAGEVRDSRCEISGLRGQAGAAKAVGSEPRPAPGGTGPRPAHGKPADGLRFG